MIVRRVSDGHSNWLWQVGSNVNWGKDIGWNFEVIFETTEPREAAEYCSWLNGGKKPEFV